MDIMQKRQHAPLETKLLSAIEVKADGESDEYLTIAGYGSVFGNRDAGGDVVMPGAFSDSLKSGRRVMMLWQHDPNQPIGVWDEITEDENGLRVRGRVVKTSGKGMEVAGLVKCGGIDGLSIGYRPQEVDRDAELGSRRLTKIDLWECSLVTFPMNSLAAIYSAKAADMTERDLERVFEDLGHSRRMAKAMAGGAWRARSDVLRDADAACPEDVQRDVDALKALLTETLSKMEARK
jgi:HK97 family phage prohead protease